MRNLLIGAVIGIPAWFGGWYLFAIDSPPAAAAHTSRGALAVGPAPAAIPAKVTPEREIEALTIADAVPLEGKFIAADLAAMKLYLYEDGALAADYPILTKGRVGSPYETPAGFYEVLSKERNHYNRGAGVHMPYSMAFYGNYFIHGWPVYDDGRPVATSYSGGCIRLSTEDAAKVFAFAQRGTDIFVYDPRPAEHVPPVALADLPIPEISAAAYLVADLDTGDVYAERAAGTPRPIASVTKLMTALVANETIMFDYRIFIPVSELTTPFGTTTPSAAKSFVIEDLLYPLLMESNNNVANRLARYYGEESFVGWMNDQARALGMTSTVYADPSGLSRENVSTPEDLYRLAVYLANKKSFVWAITRTKEKSIVADDGSSYSFDNYNIFSNVGTFVGGKVGETAAAKETMESVFTFPIDGRERRIAIIVLGSESYTNDTEGLLAWFMRSANPSTACASCARVPRAYRQIPL